MAITLRPLIAAEAAYAEQDRIWRAAMAELEDLPSCGHFFRYRDGCRRCALHLTLDRAENALARLSGSEPPNQSNSFERE